MLIEEDVSCSISLVISISKLFICCAKHSLKAEGRRKAGGCGEEEEKREAASQEQSELCIVLLIGWTDQRC